MRPGRLRDRHRVHVRAAAHLVQRRDAGHVATPAHDPARALDVEITYRNQVPVGTGQEVSDQVRPPVARPHDGYPQASAHSLPPYRISIREIRRRDMRLRQSETSGAPVPEDVAE